MYYHYICSSGNIEQGAINLTEALSNATRVMCARCAICIYYSFDFFCICVIIIGRVKININIPLKSNLIHWVGKLLQSESYLFTIVIIIVLKTIQVIDDILISLN